MYTQCPHCHTLFRIHPEHLNAAQGRARCSRCARIFNATEHLRASPDPLIEEPEAVQPEQEHSPSRSAAGPAPGPEREELGQLFQQIQIDTPPASEFDLEEELNQQQALFDGLKESFSDSGTLSDLEAVADIELEIDQLDTPVIEIDSELFSDPAPDVPLDRDKLPPSPEPVPSPTPEPVAEKPKTKKPDATRVSNSRTKPDDRETDLPFDIPYGLPAIEPTPEEGLSVDGITGNTRNGAGYRIIGFLSILLLFLLALGQFAWLERDRLLEYPQARTMLQQICQLANCKLPVRRDLGEFRVLSRRVGSHPEVKNALRVKVDFANQASFAQPYPQLLLSLFDINEVLAARRLFTPEEYLGHPQSGHSLLQPGQKVSVEMGLDDPGETLTGFKFDFR